MMPWKKARRDRTSHHAEVYRVEYMFAVPDQQGQYQCSWRRVNEESVLRQLVVGMGTVLDFGMSS